MDKATFSTADVGGYAVDGPFLARLLERLHDIAVRNGADHIQTTVEIAMRNGPYGTVKRSHKDATPLLDGSYPQQPDKLNIMIYGIAPSQGEHTSFVLTVDLDRSRGGFLMAQGPAALATEGFETIRGAMAAAESLSREPARIPPMSVEDAGRYAKARTSVLVRETLDLMRFVVPALLAAGLFGWGLMGPRADTAWSMFLSAAMVLLAFGQSYSYPERRNERRRRAVESAREAGLPPPIAEAGQRRSIDLAGEVRGTDDRSLTHEPLVPLSI